MSAPTSVGRAVTRAPPRVPLGISQGCRAVPRLACVRTAGGDASPSAATAEGPHRLLAYVGQGSSGPPITDEPNVTPPLRIIAPTSPVASVIEKRRNSSPALVMRATSQGSAGVLPRPGSYLPPVLHARVSTRTLLMTTSTGGPSIFMTRRKVARATGVSVGLTVGACEQPTTKIAARSQSSLRMLSSPTDLKGSKHLARRRHDENAGILGLVACRRLVDSWRAAEELST